MLANSEATLDVGSWEVVPLLKVALVVPNEIGVVEIAFVFENIPLLTVSVLREMSEVIIGEASVLRDKVWLAIDDCVLMVELDVIVSKSPDPNGKDVVVIEKAAGVVVERSMSLRSSPPLELLLRAERVERMLVNRVKAVSPGTSDRSDSLLSDDAVVAMALESSTLTATLVCAENAVRREVDRVGKLSNVDASAVVSIDRVVEV